MLPGIGQYKIRVTTGLAVLILTEAGGHSDIGPERGDAVVVGNGIT